MLARFVTFILVGLVLVGAAFADTTGTATGHVYVNVVSNIAVSVITPNVSLGSIQMGLFPGEITFRIDANQEAVGISVGATQLYKGDDPTNPTVAPIPIATALGALIEPTNASPFDGGTNVAMFTSPFDNNGFLGFQSEYIVFESSQPGYFSQPVFVTVAWNQDNPEKPQGQYSGFVALFATLVI